MIEPYLVGRDSLDIPTTLAQQLGSRAIQLWEDGSRGALLAELAPAISQLEGHYRSLPDSAEALFKQLQELSEPDTIQLAVGKRTEQGTPIALWDGKHGAAQTLRPGIQNPVLYQLIIAFAAQDMLRRYLADQPLLGQYETLNRSEAITIRND